MPVRLTHVRLRTRILAWSFVPSAAHPLRGSGRRRLRLSRVTEQQAVQRDQELARLSAANLAAEISQFSLDLGSLTRQSEHRRRPIRRDRKPHWPPRRTSSRSLTRARSSSMPMASSPPLGRTPRGHRQGLVVAPILRPASALTTAGLLRHHPRRRRARPSGHGRRAHHRAAGRVQRCPCRHVPRGSDLGQRALRRHREASRGRERRMSTSSMGTAGSSSTLIRRWWGST